MPPTLPDDSGRIPGLRGSAPLQSQICAAVPASACHQAFRAVCEVPRRARSRHGRENYCRYRSAEDLRARDCAAIICPASVPAASSMALPSGLDIQRIVLAGKLRELVGRIVEILLCDLETLLEKHSFAVRGRSGQFGNERIQLVDIGTREGCGSLGIVIGHADGR